MYKYYILNLIAYSQFNISNKINLTTIMKKRYIEA